ncbi:hypothetical protein [Bacteroides sp. 51]|uniref:hypothetical protein n=1 Tax=Bacteroides sp. 51 TaxID=2302938 RepID=UPI0013CF9049|nr:hypothetical protein [Bacteroides sp. 51]NDV81651.1 hypothetical protein [Bacteroides sp. 51]
MKLHNIIVFVFAFLVVSCTKDDSMTNPVTPADSRAFTFDVYIPQEQTIATRGETIQPGMIDNLYVLVFDANGTFLTRAQATAAAEPGKYNVLLSQTDPDAPQEERKRIIHFVCNYNWSGFSDVHHVGKHENEVVAGLSVTGGTIAYWQRVELANGIVQHAFPATIELLRNVAKISVLDNSIYNPTMPYLSETQFVLGDYYDYGTIAPFNTGSLTFEEGAVCESPYATSQAVSESSFVKAGGGMYSGETILCYERKNSHSKTPMYIIIKGKYSGDQKYYYYKIDVIDEGKEELFDITRNYHYIIDIQEISGPGKPSLQEAVNSPASNNLLYSVLLEDYTAISDGYSALKVEMTSTTIVRPNKEFSISFSYVPDISSGIEDNGLVTIELQQDPLALVVDPASQVIDRTAGEAKYTAKTVAVVPEYDVYTAKVILKATYNGVTLRRVVSLRFRQPSEFEQVYVSPSGIPASAGEEVELHFTIPSDIRSSLFPLEVFITTLSLTPNLAYNDEDRLTLDYSVPGVYRYKYIVRDAEDYILHFKTTSTTTNETLRIESELFAAKEIVLKN